MKSKQEILNQLKLYEADGSATQSAQMKLKVLMIQ